MATKLTLGIAALVLLASAPATAADLVNKGGTSDVPTYNGRVYYIKPSGASCPTGFTCFCNSGSSCTLPSSPSIITGTVIIDRSGVTLDCQNRMIQPPGFNNSRQQCTVSLQCGQHSSGSPQHACVNGYCQLGNLGGINVGGPLEVDDGSININVNATGFVQDVQIRNCKVRNHYAGYVHQGFDGDNGRDDLDVYSSELRGNQIGLYLFGTDDTQVWGNYVHDNIETGMDLEYNWQLRVSANTVIENGSRQLYFHGDSNHVNRWLEVSTNTVLSSHPAPTRSDAGNVLVLDLEGTIDASCDSASAICDLRFESNDVTADDEMPEVELRRSHYTPSTLLRSNHLRQHRWVVDVYIARFDPQQFHNDPRCWNKGNVCYLGSNSYSAQVPCVSSPSTEFSAGWCWY